MPFNSIHEYDANVAANNTNIGGNNIAEGCAPSGINNALRELARQVRAAVSNQGSDIASSATTDIGGATGQYVKITGTSTITALGTVNAGTMRWVEFAATLTLTNNANVKLPGGANIVTGAGDVACFVSQGAGVWKCVSYQRADGSALNANMSSSTAGTIMTLTSSDAGIGAGPDIVLDRNSASPAVNDNVGAIRFKGRDSAGNVETYAEIATAIEDPTNGSEDGSLFLGAPVSGSMAYFVLNGGSFNSLAVIGGPKGSGTINVNGVYIKGHGTVAQVVSDTKAILQTSASTIPADNTIPQITEGAEVLTASITPSHASSQLYIEVQVQLGGSTTTDGTAALFVDSTANALAAAGTRLDVSTMHTIAFTHVVSAGSTSARTYRVRVGLASGTVSLNGANGNQRYGGVSASALVVREVLPQ
jgi:hypothetical protein